MALEGRRGWRGWRGWRGCQGWSWALGLMCLALALPPARGPSATTEPQSNTSTSAAPTQITTASEPDEGQKPSSYPTTASSGIAPTPSLASSRRSTLGDFIPFTHKSSRAASPEAATRVPCNCTTTTPSPPTSSPSSLEGTATVNEQTVAKDATPRPALLLDRAVSGYPDDDEHFTRLELLDSAALNTAQPTAALLSSLSSGRKLVKPSSGRGVLVGSTNITWPVKMAAVVDGDLVLGGLMMVHEREDHVVCGPIMPQGGIQALEAMLFTLDVINGDKTFLPNVTLGAHILDDCDKDTYGLEMAVDFIKGSISNIDDAKVQCNQSAARKVISGVVGAASSVTSIQVANLLRLFRIPQVSFFSTSPELSNKQRFEFFSRTIPSDHYQVAAMVEIVKRMNWTYVSIVYEESNYGIKAYEELERVLNSRDVCIAVKEKLEKDSGVADEESYDKIVGNLLTKPRAKGVIIFASDQEVAELMRAVRRLNATGHFSWIGSDGWSARSLVSESNEAQVEGTLSVQPQANPVTGFQEYFLSLTPENNTRNPWFIEFWEAHFRCRYNNSPLTPHNLQWSNHTCAHDLRLSRENTDFEDQLQFVSDAVMAFAHALKQMHQELCGGRPGLCESMQPTDGNTLLGFLRNVSFIGLSGDKFQFDKNGDGPARYNIIHFKQVKKGSYSWVRVGEYSGSELHLNMSEIQFQLNQREMPVSVCSLPCAQGQSWNYVERETCCWHCINCSQYEVRNEMDVTRCEKCPNGTLPDPLHVRCIAIPEEFLHLDSGWAIGAMAFSCFGIATTLVVLYVFITHHNTPVVRASGRELSYVLLTGILCCYCVTFLLVLKPTDTVCGLQRFSAGFCFTMVYAALFIKTNRIARIFHAGKRSTKRPSFVSPRSQLVICGFLLLVQILINVVWMLLSPPKAVHWYPSREDNVLVCSSHMDASYMIAFGYPIMLILVCTVYAVLTRKIPGSFNESQHIGFTMYTTCVIWLAFVPLFFATANHVALRITSMSVTISLSAFVTVACLFTPKLYIIIFHPERNVRSSVMPKASKITSTIKNSAGTTATVTATASGAGTASAAVRPVVNVTVKFNKATQSEDCHANGGIRTSRSQQTSLQELAISDSEPEPPRVNGPVEQVDKSATEVLGAHPNRLPSMDFIDTDVERIVNSPVAKCAPVVANNCHHNHTNHCNTSPSTPTCATPAGVS